jgi:hypothetical protein
MGDAKSTRLTKMAGIQSGSFLNTPSPERIANDALSIPPAVCPAIDGRQPRRQESQIELESAHTRAYRCHDCCLTMMKVLQAAGRKYRWCKPPTIGSESMGPTFGGSTALAIGQSFFRPKCV